jgi:transcriptional regulator with XRE-family HTH domain
MTLADWMAEHLLTDEGLATQLGCDRATISRLRRGLTRPSWEMAAKIKEVTNEAVSADDFLPVLSQS